MPQLHISRHTKTQPLQPKTTIMVAKGREQWPLDEKHTAATTYTCQRCWGYGVPRGAGTRASNHFGHRAFTHSIATGAVVGAGSHASAACATTGKRRSRIIATGSCGQWMRGQGIRMGQSPAHAAAGQPAHVSAAGTSVPHEMPGPEQLTAAGIMPAVAVYPLAQ